MKLEYQIMWFENDIEYFESIKPLVKDYMDNLGFNLEIKLKSGDEDIYPDEINDMNLILMDLSLDSSKNGDVLIKLIRKHDAFIEIIFYSEDSKALKKSLKKLGFVEGVYMVSGRTNLTEKIKKIINLTLKKSQDVNNLRGLVIAEAIDLEMKMDDIILKYFNLEQDEKKEVFKERVLGIEVITTAKKVHLVNRICKERIKVFNKNLQEDTLTSEEKKKLQENISTLTQLKTEFQNIMTEVIKIRNTLAHVKESQAGKNTLESTLREYSTININDEWCNETRKNIRKHSKNLDMIIAFI